MNIDKTLLEAQITTLGDQLNKNLTDTEREHIEGLLNLLGDIADEKPVTTERKQFLLTETNAEVIAIITEKTDLHYFYKSVRQAIAENLGIKSTDVTLNIGNPDFDEDTIQYTFDADIIEDEEEYLREYYLTELTTY